MQVTLQLLFLNELKLLQQGYGRGGDAFFTAGETEFFRSSRFDGYAVDVDFQGAGDVDAHFFPVGADFGELTDDGGIDIDDFIARFPDQAFDIGQQDQAVRVFPFRVRRREMFADITQSGGSQEGVADGVAQHVRIAVPGETFIEGDFHSAEDKFAIRRESVDVEALAYAVVICHLSLVIEKKHIRYKI